jgi:Holliday junction DNA helicase RuvA
MIGSLRGLLAAKNTERIVIDVGGVGYEVSVPLSTFTELPEEGAEISILTHTHVREDVLVLFGFLTSLEREVFRLLITVSGVGPRLALNLLSGLSAPEVVRGIVEGNVAPIVSVPGIGRRTAERLLIDLRERMMKLDVPAGTDATPRKRGDGKVDREAEDALAALKHLGYRPAQAEKVLAEVRESLPGAPLERILRESLRQLAGLS